ncbi:MAG TPA: hypothetical protein VFB29_01385 [Pseudolabrys sp.]|nr:hypothetical protein [Pseudolabrys sp.]
MPRQEVFLSREAVPTEPAANPPKARPAQFRHATAKAKPGAKPRTKSGASASTAAKTEPSPAPATLASGASAATEKAPEQPAASDPALDKAKVTVAAKMEDPSSAVFDNLKRAMRKNAFGYAVDTICGQVRGKKPSGEDTGERPFLYLVKEDQAYIVDDNPASVAATAYRTICTGQ